MWEEEWEVYRSSVSYRASIDGNDAEGHPPITADTAGIDDRTDANYDFTFCKK